MQKNKRLRNVAKKIIFAGLEPRGPLRPVFAAFFQAHWWLREMYEWARRSLVATPVFLSQCAVHGTAISVDRIPYMNGRCRIELGSRIRISGLLNIKGSTHTEPVLRIGSGVFIGHGCTLAVAHLVEIGDFSSIGAGTYIADTEGHSNYNPQRPIWEVPASASDIGPVVIEDNVQISRQVIILKGVRIGARSIIGAGAVVRSDIPPDSVVMGNPARVVKRLTPDIAPATAQASQG
jgi:acetyltransferase-like isoleucine patch superfamily enzyme